MRGPRNFGEFMAIVAFGSIALYFLLMAIAIGKRVIEMFH